MASLLLNKSRFLRALTLLATLALLIAYQQAPSDAASAAVSVRLRLANRCDRGSLYTMKVAGVTAFSNFGPPNTGTCGTPSSITDGTTTDATVLAAVGSNVACTQLTLNVGTGTSNLLQWSRVDITRADGGVEAICISDATNGGCATATVPNGSFLNMSSATTLANVLPDTDADGTLDCTDTDIDNDSVLNDADNCPALSNAGQEDRDNDGQGDACEKAVVAVPWLGSELLPHQVTSGGSITLQASAINIATGAALSLTSGTWDPGDGSGPQAITVTNGYNLEKVHTYTGANDQPFTATISVTEAGGAVYTDTFKVIIKPDTRETRVNMAIDKGLWWQHKNITRNTSNGLPSGSWAYSSWPTAATASAVQAFEVNNHRESGDPLRDPYVLDVALGLKFLLSSDNGKMISIAVPLQNANNPDSNGNGYGLVVSNTDHSSYITGQVIDAIVASGTPNKVAVTGEATRVKGRTYKDIVQDLLDGYSYGIADNTGGWHYTYQGTTGNNDTSASHWWAIGVLAAETWNLDSPAWVKNLVSGIGFPLMQAYDGINPCINSTVTTNNALNGDNINDGHFGYTNNKHWEWDYGSNVTAAGLVMMNAVDLPSTNARFTCASKYLADRYNATNGVLYTMYQTTKAMRTALDATGTTTPITMLNGTIDWYAGYADYLVSHQNAAGQFLTAATSTAVGPGGDNLGNAWSIIILSPTLFELPPTAACSVTPATIGKFGGTVNFNASASFHPDSTATITGYSWSFDDGTPNGSGVTTSHSYAVPASFPTTRNATVTVTDSNGNSSTASCPVTIVNNNVPPSASINGPYTVCQGSPAILTAEAADEDGTVSLMQWDLSSPVNFASIDATGSAVDATALFASKAPGTYDIGFRATDDNSAVTSVFSTVTVLAATNPACNQPPVAVDDTASTFSGTPVTINVLANDTDPDDGDALSTTSATNGSNGSVVVNGDGTVTYSPNTGFAGTDTFTYAMTDGQGGTDSATVTVIVKKRAATLMAGSGSKVYGGADPVLTPNSSGFLGDITVAQTPRDGGEDVGTYATHAEATGATISNYDVTYQDGTFTITQAGSTAAATGGTFDYDGTPHAGSCSFGGVNGEVLTGTLTYSSGSTPVNAGDYTVNCDFAGNNNYTGSSASASITIKRKAATVTADSGTKVFGTADPALGATSSGFLAVDAINVEYVGRDNGEGVATYATHAGASGAGINNYDVTYTDGSLVITPASTTAVATGGTFVYDALPHAGTCVVTSSAPASATPPQESKSSAESKSTEASSSTPSGPTGFTGTITYNTVDGNAPVDAGEYTITCSYPGDANHTGSSSTATITIEKAPSVTVVSCTDGVYTSSALTTCTANVTGAGGLDQAVSPVTYSNNTNVGTAGASATYDGDANHLTSTGTSTFEITPASTTTVVTCSNVVYNGAAQETCTANVTGAGGLDQSLTVSYTNNVNVGTATGSASYAGDANHSSSNSSATFQITPAPSTTVVTCPASVVYSGAVQTPCTANVTGVGGLNETLTVSYANNTNVGTASASATFAGDANHDGSSNSTTFEITQAPTATSINAPTITVAANGTVTVSVASTSGQVLGTVSLTVDGGAAVTQALFGGSSVFTVTSPDAGDHALVATYAAQGNFAASSATGNLHVNPSPTATVLTTSATPQLAGTPVTFTATVTSVAPGSGTPNGIVTFKEGTTVLGTGTLNAAGVATFTTTTLSNGPHTITASYNGVNNYLPSTANTVSKLIFGLATGGGTFVIGDNNATLNTQVMFWGAQWEKNNSMTGGSSNASFKGFAISPSVPTVGATFTSAPGNSAPPPAGVPQYLGIIVTSKVTKSGSNITGTIVKLVVVLVDPGYQGSPGHAGTGKIVAFVQ